MNGSQNRAITSKRNNQVGVHRVTITTHILQTVR
jgi:hypothetical protein